MQSHGATLDLSFITTILDALQCGAILIDRAGTVLHANGRWLDWVGRPAQAIVGRPLIETYTEPDARQAVQTALARFDTPLDTTYDIVRPDGTRVSVASAGRPLGERPPLSDLRVITLQDISRQKQAEAAARTQFQEVSKLSDTVLEQAIELKHYSARLEERVRERTRELNEANMDAIYMLAVASEAKDQDTGAHVLRIRYFAELLALQLGLPPHEAAQIGYSAILHDVGKMQVPDEILKKPAALDDIERDAMKRHTVVGERILSHRPFFEMARQIARHHHENWDGSGYPDGQSGRDIPLAARIVHVADVFDALTSSRPYKDAWSIDQAAAAIEAGRGKQFEPAIVDAFWALFRAGQFTPEAASATLSSDENQALLQCRLG